MKWLKIKMRIIKQLKYDKALINAIIFLIWMVYLFLLFLNFFAILDLSWFWLLSPLWIIPMIIVLIAITALLLVIIF